jgi:hypothetical protein
MRWGRFRVAASVAMMAIGCGTPAEPLHLLAGEVTLRDELGSTRSARDGVTVVLVGATGTVDTTRTGADGGFAFEVRSLDPATLRFARDGFGTTQVSDVVPDAGRIAVLLTARSTAVVTALSGSADFCGTTACLRLRLNVDSFFAGTSRRLFRVFVGATPKVSDHDYAATGILVVPNDQPGLVVDGTAASFELAPVAGLLGGFQEGTTVHVVVFGATENWQNSFEDPETGLEIFTDLSGASARITVEIPQHTNRTGLGPTS